MSKKKDGSGGNAVIAVAGIAVPLMLRKVLMIVWTKVVGKEPPIGPDGP